MLEFVAWIQAVDFTLLARTSVFVGKPEWEMFCSSELMQLGVIGS